MSYKDVYRNEYGIYRLNIYILCRDRIDYLKECLESVLLAAENKANIIISDNSIGNEVENFILDKYKNINYIKRYPAIGVLEHHHSILKENNAEYLVMFHDDDLMKDNYVEKMLKLIEADDSLVAVGCNANIIIDNIKTKTTFIRGFNGIVNIDRYEIFLQHYLKISSYGPAPFPSYIYRMSRVGNKYMQENQGGKYSDSSFLVNLLINGNIVWSLEPYMWYRIHGGNGNKQSSLKDRLSWFRWLKSLDQIKNSRFLKDFKFLFYFEWYRENKIKKGIVFPRTKKEKVIVKFLIIKGIITALTNYELWKILIIKITK